ncbi:MAG: ABC transporter substrate-binding protein [Rhizobacter sp.]|nr:ABC transporter substrate-binding protein [Chlorobiales bacterium]
MRFIFKYLLPFSLLIIVSACGGRKDNAPQADTTAFKVLNGGIKQGGVFRRNNASDIASLDPVRTIKQGEIYIAQQIYSLLVNLNDSSLALEPGLAETWEISPDGLTYTFHLRNDVHFHDDPCFADGKGKLFTANDAKYSLTRILDARTQTLGASFFTTCVEGASQYYDATIEALKSKAEPKVSSVSGFIVKDDTTFVIKLSAPYAPFLYHLASNFGYLTCKEAVDKYGSELARHPVGTGAFVFVRWDEDREVVLKRNPNYWQRDEFGNQLPYLDGLSFKFLKEASSQLLEFQKGSFDESLGIPQEFTAQIFDANGNVQGDYKKYVLKSIPELRIDYIAMQCQDPLFKNVKLRQAVSSAIDRQKIVKFVLKNQVVAATGVVPVGFDGYDNSGIQVFDFNIERSKKLLAEAGYPNGAGLPEFEINTFTGAKYAYNKEVAEAVQAMLKEVGIAARITQQEYSTHLGLAYPGKLKFFLASWGADYPEPETFLNLVYGEVVPKEPQGESYLNMSRYKSAAFDSVFTEALKISDQTARYARYKEAEQIAMQDAPLILSYYRLLRRFQQPYVRNYPINAMDRPDYKRVWLDK